MSDTSICWVVSLGNEAKVIVRQLRLTRFSNEFEYEVFTNKLQSIWLIVSGISRLETIKATKLLQVISNASKWTIWINIGFAYSLNQKVGELCFIDKIIDEKSSTAFYTGVVIEPRMKRASLLTVGAKSHKKRHLDLIDYQAASFMEVVSKFTYREHIIVMKLIVGDQAILNRQCDNAIASKIVLERLGAALKHVERVSTLCNMPRKRSINPETYSRILAEWKFTEFQSHQLKSLISRWDAGNLSINMLEEIRNFKNSREVISYLSRTLEKFNIDWNTID